MVVPKHRGTKNELLKKAKPKLLNKFRRLNHLYHIQDLRSKKLVRMRLNKEQCALYFKEKTLKEKYGKVWHIILKARQIWFTTYKLAEKLDKCLFYRDTNAIIVAHDREKAEEIFQRLKLMYERIPDVIVTKNGKWRKPIPKYDNKREYYFPSMNSRIKITLDARSGSPTDAHFTEVAFYKKLKEILRGALPALEFSNLTMETTANGMNEFHALWQNNHEKIWSQFATTFVPWWTSDDYESDLLPGEKVSLPKELEHLKKRLKLSDRKLKRYIAKYKDDPQGTLQEYPSEPGDAFIFSGKPFYPLEVVRSILPIVWEKDEEIEWLIRYIRTPEADAVFGLDFAEWLDHGDESVMRVRNRKWELICSYQGNREPWKEMCDVVDHVYKQGITWTILPERNNHWHTFLYASKDYSRYGDIITYQMKQKKDSDKVYDKIGRDTNSVTRPMMLDEHKEMIKNGTIDADQELIDQMYTFVVRNKKPQAEEDCHDDVVMADAICCQGFKEESKVRTMPEWWQGQWMTRVKEEKPFTPGSYKEKLKKKYKSSIMEIDEDELDE